MKRGCPWKYFLPNNEHIQLSGRIASCIEIPVSKDEAKGISRFDIGIEFLEIEEADMEKLQGFVAGLEKAL